MKIPRYILKTIKEIESVKIQGATNVAIATCKALEMFVNKEKYLIRMSKNELLKEIEIVGNRLAWARPNEPLAQNAIKYIKYHFIVNGLNSSEPYVDFLRSQINEYMELINRAKLKIIENGYQIMKNSETIMTHCHSSTVVKILTKIQKEDHKFKVIVTETRPLYQGRITAKELVSKDIETTMVTDSSTSSVLLHNKGNLHVDAVIIGGDQINADGSLINKIGSLSIAIASNMKGIPVYCSVPLLKLAPDTIHTKYSIEMRDAKEVWRDAPLGLKIINPAFERVPDELITGYITEFGILNPSDAYSMALKEYYWMA